ncbi:MAG: hypothetical protein Q8Q18_00960, partial [bacterium]|nr:hypothetical protein [bacterium]
MILNKFFRKTLSIVTVLAMVLGITGVSGIKTVFAAGTITIAVGGANPAATTVHNVFRDEPLFQFYLNSAGSETLDGIRITALYSGTGAENDYALSFYKDVDDDGIVSDGDVQLLDYTNLTAANGGEQLFDLTNMSMTAATEYNILVLGRTVTADPADADTIRLSLDTSAVLSEGNAQSGSATSNLFTLEADDPNIAVTDGGGQPSTATILNSASNLAVQEWTITEAGASSGDTVRIVGITPTGTIDESADITSVQFYIDDGDDTFETGEDNLLSSTPATFSVNDTKENFTITGGIKVPIGGSVNVWVVYNLASSASNGETIIQNIAVGTDVTMGSGVALSADATDVAEGPSSAQTIDATAPTVVDDWALNMNAGTITINFSEAMDQAIDVDETTITLQESADTDVAGEIYTLTNSTSAWSDSDTLLITLSATDLDAIKSDSGLGVSTITSFLEIVAGNGMTDVIELALDLTNVTDGAAIDATGFTADTTPPTVTVTAASVDAGGDTITLTFDEPMDVTTITTALLQADSSITLDYSTAADSVVEADITVGNATVAWTGLTVATITLDEETDLAYIPSGKFIGVTLASVTDMASVAEVGGEVYTSAGITAEVTSPTFTVEGTSVNDGVDTIALTFNEAIDQSTLTQEDVRAGTVVALYLSDYAGDTGQAYIVVTTATASWDATGKIFTISLDENTDGAYIPDGKFVGVSTDGSITDLPGNAVAVTEIYTSSAVSKEANVPTFTVTGTSINDGGDTIALTFNEIMDVTTLTTAILQAGTNIQIDYDDDGADLNEVSLDVSNASVVWSVNNTVATITLDEET